MKRERKDLGQGGFTLIELLMFVAVSGALFSLLIISTYRMIDNAHFADSITSATSFVQLQYEDARSGARPTGNIDCNTTAATGGKSDCYLLGKAIVFHDLRGDDGCNAFNCANDQIESYYVIGQPSAGADISISKGDTYEGGNSGLNKVLRDMKPTLILNGAETYKLLNDSHYAVVEEPDFLGSGMIFRNKSGAEGDGVSGVFACMGGLVNSCGANVVLVLRNPLNASVNTYMFNVSTDMPTTDNPNAVVLAINTAIARNDYGIFHVESTVSGTEITYSDGYLAHNASMAVVIANSQSSYRELAAICIEQGASTASIFSARGIGFYANVDGEPSDDQPAILRQVLRNRCENG